MFQLVIADFFYMFPIKYFQVLTCSCNAYSGMWGKGKKSIILRASAKENMAQSRDWWELHPDNPLKEETDTSQAKTNALFPKMMFSLMLQTSYIKMWSIAVCFISPQKNKCDQTSTVAVVWNRGD